MDLPVKVMRLGLDGSEKRKKAIAYTLFDYAGDEDFAQEAGIAIYVATKKANYEVILTEQTLRDALADIALNRPGPRSTCDPEDNCPVCGNGS